MSFIKRQNRFFPHFINIRATLQVILLFRFFPSEGHRAGIIQVESKRNTKSQLERSRAIFILNKQLNRWNDRLLVLPVNFFPWYFTTGFYIPVVGARKVGEVFTCKI